MEANSTERRATLTKQELTKLRNMVAGYGNFKKTAALLPEIYDRTLKNVIDKGWGSPDTIEAIRETLLKVNNSF